MNIISYASALMALSDKIVVMFYKNVQVNIYLLIKYNLLYLFYKDNCTNIENGLCDKLSGECRCFSPYFGDDCSFILECP